MRKITQQAVDALFSGRNFKAGNTKVEDGTLILHWTAIAKIENGKLYVRSGGYETNTTKERLNGLPNVNIYQKNYQWFLNGVEWQDSRQWTEVVDYDTINRTNN